MGRPVRIALRPSPRRRPPAWGLIIHQQSAEARRAGRIYLVMALVGEVLLLAAFVIIVGEDLNLELFRAPLAVAGDPHPALLSVLLLVGFGIKAGAFLLPFTRG